MSPPGLYYACIASIVLWLVLFGRRVDDHHRYSIWSILVGMTIVGINLVIGRLLF
jgi:hypothetical protein